jgi:hypothetical protein
VSRAPGADVRLARRTRPRTLRRHADGTDRPLVLGIAAVLQATLNREIAAHAGLSVPSMPRLGAERAVPSAGLRVRLGN